jgi:hypothetical protein
VAAHSKACVCGCSLAGFQSRRRHGCLSLVNAVCCQSQRRANNSFRRVLSIVCARVRVCVCVCVCARARVSECECECDHEAPTVRTPRPTRFVEPRKKNYQIEMKNCL